MTVSASSAPQEDLSGTQCATSLATNCVGESFLVYSGSSPPTSPDDFYHLITLTDPNAAPAGSTCTGPVAGLYTCKVPNRSVVLTFTNTAAQTVYLWMPDDNVAQGNRVVTVNHSVLSQDPNYDGAVVRNVEVTIYDNDGPGVLVTQIDPNTTHPDNQTTVLEGTTSTTEVSDAYQIQLTSAVQAGMQVTVQINPSDTFVCLTSTDRLAVQRVERVQRPDSVPGLDEQCRCHDLLRDVQPAPTGSFRSPSSCTRATTAPRTCTRPASRT